MNKIYSFFKSIKLAIVLILLIVGLSLLSTLIPQGQNLSYYYQKYSPLIARLIQTFWLYRFFQSPIFFILSGLFFINLLTCTIDRFRREIRKKNKRRFGPDILHTGLLILVLGSVVTFASRKEGFMNLGEGDAAQLPGGYTLTLKSFEFLKYENGSPKDWISTVTVEKDGSTVVTSFPIEVNRPLKIGNLEVFQNSYSVQSVLSLLSDTGSERTLSPGDYIELKDSVLVFAGGEESAQGGRAFFQEWKNRQLVGEFQVPLGEKLAGNTLMALNFRSVTGLQVVIDPGFLPVLIGLIILAIGLFLTYFQKLGEKK